MPELNLIGQNDPFLHCTLQKGEMIHCEADAMVMMESNLELKGTMRGGLFQSLARRFANGESLFQQHIRAERGSGDCLLAPTLDGDLLILDVGSEQFCLNDGAYVAATEHVELKAKIQRNLGGAIFGDTGGFVISETSGSGKLVVCGFGILFTLDVTPGQDCIIDNGHVVCWDSSLTYNLSVSTSQDRGFLGNIMNSVTSGEGMVLRFSGSGKVVVCSRNRTSYTGWIQSLFNGS